MSRTFRSLASIALAAFVPIVLGSCSGAVGGPANATGGPITISPDTATLYSDLPTTFVITGGNGSYIVTSSDQQAVPLVGATTSGAFTVVPNEVAADTPVTLTVRDTGSSAPATASLTVKPRTVSNVVTVTPSASQSAACGTAICSGGDAEVKVVLAQGGVPLVGREVRFDVVSGDIRVITSPPGVDEVDSLSGSTTTDATGTARIRIRVLANATSQTAILQITDVSSGFTQTTSATIAASTNAPLTAVPNVVRFTGPDGSSCASGIGADVIVSGGRPPYQIAQTAAFIISPTTVTQSGGTFTVKSTGQCAEEGLVIGTGGTAIAIVDASGGSTSVTAINNPAPATPTSSFIVSPTSVTFDSCDAVATFNLIGGTGSYSFASGSNGLAVKKISASQMTIGRTNTVPTRTTITSTPITVSFTDGKSAIPVVVNLVGAAIGTCPP